MILGMNLLCISFIRVPYIFGLASAIKGLPTEIETEKNSFRQLLFAATVFRMDSGSTGSVHNSSNLRARLAKKASQL